jgi:hypothetical protein
VPPSALTSAQLHDVAASMNQEIRTISTTLVVRVFARSASGLTLRAIDSEFLRDAQIQGRYDRSQSRSQVWRLKSATVLIGIRITLAKSLSRTHSDG